MGLLDKSAVPRVDTAFQDADHDVGAELLNAIVATLDGGSGRRAHVAELLSRLVHHLMEHFQREEDEMERAHFPPVKVHTTEHWRVLAEVRGQLEAWSRGAPDDDLAAYLRGPFVTWYVDHISSMDTATARWLNRHRR